MSIVQDYLLMIINCKKYKSKALYQKATWLKTLPSYLKYYHVIGDPSLSNEFIFDHENNLLIVKTGDDYNSLPKKVLAAHNAFCHTFKFKYLFKTDDDQILVSPNFFNGLTEMLQQSIVMNGIIHYGGFVVDVKQKELSDYQRIHPELPNHYTLEKTKYCSGRFYFLSRNAICVLQVKRELVEKEFLEDYAIGYHLHAIFKKRMVHIATNHYFTDIEKSDFPEWVKLNNL